MSTPNPRSPRRPLPWGLIGMLGLVILVEAGLEAHHLDFTRFYIHDWRFSGHAAHTLAAPCRVLCLGDSLVKFGLIPRAIADGSGGEAYNLAVCDGQAASSYFLLRRALASGARPETVVVDFVPHLLDVHPRHNLRQWPELLAPAEAVDLACTTGHAGFFAALALGSLLPSVKDRHEIRGSVVAALAGRSASRRGEIPDFVGRWRRDRGANLAAERPSYDGSIDAENPAYFPRRWACHPANERYVRRLLDLASRHGVRVAWLLPPVVPGFQDRRERLGLEACYTRFAQTLVHDYKNLVVIDARRAGYDRRLFIDPLHLSRRGAERLSGDVATALASFRAGPAGATRWAALGDRPRSPDGPTRAGLGSSPVALRVPDEGRRP